MTLNQAIEIAKEKAVGNAKWTRAIERAAAGLKSGDICVTLFCDGYALVTTANNSYRVNGVCTCAAAQNGHTQCVHRAAKRLVEMTEETAPVAVTLADDVAESSRENIIAEIKNIYPRVEPTVHLADAIMYRWGVNKLEMLPTETLRDFRLALAA